MSRKSTISNKKGFIPIESKSRTGFTIIEVVLVLAIAGLIFLIVFRALPGLQKNRRDTTRKSDLSSMAAQLESAAGNNGGSYPDAPTAGSGIQSLLSGFTPDKDPQGGSYNVNAAGTGSNANSIIQYIRGGICSNGVATGSPVANGTPTYKYAISLTLEMGSVCKDGGQTPS